MDKQTDKCMDRQMDRKACKWTFQLLYKYIQQNNSNVAEKNSKYTFSQVGKIGCINSDNVHN